MSRNEAFVEDDYERDEGKPSRKRYEKKNSWPDHYNPKPGELDAPWPTVRTETFVEMVFGVIKDNGQCTQGEIVKATNLSKEKVGVALADLVLWRETVGHELRYLERGEERVYFLK